MRTGPMPESLRPGQFARTPSVSLRIIRAVVPCPRERVQYSGVPVIHTSLTYASERVLGCASTLQSTMWH